MIPLDKQLTQEYVRQYFDYADGVLVWKNRTGTRKGINGKIAGTINDQGYCQIGWNKKAHLAHRLIFLFHHGYLPEQVDHIDGNRSNNLIENLRGCTSTGNNRNASAQSNNKTGIKGVFWCNTLNKWYARVWANGRFVVNKSFDDIELAELVAIEGREKYHMEFARHA